MNVKFINPFLEGTTSVLNTMAFIAPRAGKPYLKKDSMAVGDISGIIGLTGAARGSLALSFSKGCILKIVSNMLGEEINEINGDIKDAVGELTNMVSGGGPEKTRSGRPECHGRHSHRGFGSEPFHRPRAGRPQHHHPL